MAGHSKWANIKRQKARVDTKKGQIFTKLSREIIVAARHGLPDPAGNFQLRTAIAKAKAAGMPNYNIERAIAKGAGRLEGAADLEEVRYEGYGPGGIAVLVEALTDNRNRTAADLRVAFSKNGGNLGETGCVSWLFSLQGVVSLAGPLNEEQLLEDLLANGADSYQLIEEGAEILTSTTNLESLVACLKAQGYTVTDAEFRWTPTNIVNIQDLEQAQQVLKMMDAIEDLDDVQMATANFEISEEALSILYAEKSLK
jgi:YebC/PmpR family DNA-binding regulatory protein